MFVKSGRFVHASLDFFVNNLSEKTLRQKRKQCEKCKISKKCDIFRDTMTVAGLKPRITYSTSKLSTI